MIDIVSALFEAHGYEKINLEQGFLFLYPNSMEKKDFWIVIEEDDLLEDKINEMVNEIEKRFS